MERLVYHYCSNVKMDAILSSKTLRMCDITKSNDYDELKLFFPGLLYAIEDQYRENSFDFQYDGEEQLKALKTLLKEESDLLQFEFHRGGVTNLVVCFCEEGDQLSQWRGYADDGRGASLGFSIPELERYCKNAGSLVCFEKVQYVTDKELSDIIEDKAKETLKIFQKAYGQFADDFSSLDKQEKGSRMLKYFFHYIILCVLISSLKYKNVKFEEEKEWRLYFRKPFYKMPEWICGTEEIDTLFYDDMIKFVQNKIGFNVTRDDIVPYYPIQFTDISDNPIKQIISGPKSKLLERDFIIYLAVNGLKNIEFTYSKIPYR